MPSTTPFSVIAGDSEPLAITLTGYDNVTAIDLRTATKIDAFFKRSQTDTDAGARIAKTLAIATITITGSPAGGTFTLAVGGQTTAAIAHDAAAADVKAALELLSTVGSGHSIVAGGPAPGTPFTAILIDGAAGQAISAAQAFTGGTGPDIAAATAGGGVAITDAINGRVTVKLTPADTKAFQSQIGLEGQLRVFLANGDAITGWKGTLTVFASDVQDA